MGTASCAIVRVPLPCGRFAIIDECDSDLVCCHPWRAATGFQTTYAATGIHPNQVLMHRLILGVPDGVLVDHVSRDGLDNRRINIRPANHSQNAANKAKQRGPYTSQYKGVWLRHDRKKWRAMIEVAGRKVYLGAHATELEAALAYDAAARQEFGEFARLNFPESINV